MKGGQYYLISSEEIKGATLKIMDGDEVIKEVNIDINRGLNPINLSDLPKGQLDVKLFRNGLPLEGVSLGYLGKVKSVNVLSNELLFELESGELVSPSRLIYVGGV